MKSSTLIRRIQMECPLCDKVHEVEERTRITTIIMKGEKVTYQERFYFCCNSAEEECEFATGTMANANLMSARNAYRQSKGLLTSDEIVKIREDYGLSQVELANLLGWGEATISRYESKAIQDEAYDIMLRDIKDNPLKAIEFLERNKQKFSVVKRAIIYSKMVEKMNAYGKEFLSRQDFKSEYVKYSEPADENGYQVLDIDKVEYVISYFASKVQNLYKVKTMKMLWYADALFYKAYGRTMTGLVYLHDAMGALPLGHYKMMNLENIIVREEGTYDAVKYHIYPNTQLKDPVLTSEEVAVLDSVILKFKDYTSKEIIDYMHEEEAYKKTCLGDVIPFSLAKGLREF